MAANDYRAYVENDYNALYHFGIKGQKWGIRRYQNPDGSLTAAGKARYYRSDGKMIDDNKSDSAVTRRVKKDWNNLSDSDFRSKYKVSKKRYAKRVNKYGDPYTNGPGGRNTKKTLRTAKKVAIGVGVAAGVGLAAIALSSGAGRQAASAGKRFLTDSKGIENIKGNLDWENARWAYQPGVNELMVKGRRYMGRQLALPG